MPYRDNRYRIYLRAEPGVDGSDDILTVIGRLDSETFISLRALGNCKTRRCPTIEAEIDSNYTSEEIWRKIKSTFQERVTGIYSYSNKKHHV